MTRSVARLAALSLVMTACTSTNSRVETRINQLAELIGRVPPVDDPLRWKVITSGVNQKNSSIYTLYGNELAVQYARTTSARNYPNGATLALVTWARQEDARWFGAEIPARPVSVEVLRLTSSAMAYRLYTGTPLDNVTVPLPEVGAGVARMLSLRAAVMP